MEQDYELETNVFPPEESSFNEDYDEKERLIESQSADIRRALKNGEWACQDAKCSNINQEFRNSCDKCGKSKPRARNRIGREIGKEAAEKSKGLFAAEDWSCTKCGNINWARRTTCNICNAKKLGDLEVRTGYGGGYMDREDVEYIERDDEDEFDEFGRKKKRRRVENDEEKRSVVAEIDQEDVPSEKEGMEFAKNIRLEVESVGKIKMNTQEEPGDEVEVDKYDENDDNDDPDFFQDDANLDKYDLSAEPDLASLINNGNLARRSAPDESPRSSSGGECSCQDSDEVDQQRDDRRRIRDRSPRSHEHRRR